MSSSKRSIMTLYSGSNDIYSHRVRIVLAEKNVTYDLVEVESSPRSMEELASFNPYCSVPTLVDRDLVLYKSEIIMEYLDERFPHPPLMPVYPVAKGRSRLMIHRINQDWYSMFEKIQSRDSSAEVVAAAKKDLLDGISSVVAVFEQMPYFLSEEFSLIDCCILPLLWRFPKYGLTYPPGTEVIKKYAETLFARETFIESLTDVEKLIKKQASHV